MIDSFDCMGNQLAFTVLSNEIRFCILVDQFHVVRRPRLHLLWRATEDMGYAWKLFLLNLLTQDLES